MANKGKNPIRNPGIYYHVAGEGYEPGDDLYSWDELESKGVPMVWKYEGDEPFDTDVISLFETLGEARGYQEEYGGTILEVDLREPDGNMVGTVVEEGYPAVHRHIPAEFLKPVK